MMFEHPLRFMPALMLAMLILAPGPDAAPVLRLKRLGVQPSSLRGDHSPPDSWTSGPEDRDTTPTLALSKLYDDTISSPIHLDKILAAALKTAETNSELRRTAGYSDEWDDPETKEKLKLSIPDTTFLSRKAKTELATRRSDGTVLTPVQKFMKTLNALEELHKNLNGHMMIITKGNSIRSSGKKSKTLVTDGSIKSTTMSSVVSGGTSPRVSTDQVDPKHLTGRAFKKSLPSPPKKTNKRVCFWKYCSQN